VSLNEETSTEIGIEKHERIQVKKQQERRMKNEEQGMYVSSPQ